MIAALVLAAASNGPVKPVRSLAYAFTVTSPASTYSGTINADVLGVDKSGDLVIRFTQSVTGQPNLSYPTTQCTVYGDTRVECGKDQKNLSSVETEVARLLGRNFVDGNNLDANNHWQIAGKLGADSETDDFTVTANDNGVVSITEKREITGANPSSHAGTISYDMNRTIPLSVKYTDGPGATPTSVQVTLTSDSLQTAKPSK